MGHHEAKCRLIYRLICLQARRVCLRDLVRPPGWHSPRSLTQQLHIKCTLPQERHSAMTLNGKFLIRLTVKNVQLIYVSTEELLQDL